MTNGIYAPKRSCPRNNGYFYCDECYSQALEEVTCTGYPCDICQHPFLGCGKEVGGRFCGYTHLGYSWCDECKKLGRLECTHYGFECVGVIQGEQTMKTVYIKFLNSKDVYAICPSYDLGPDDYVSPKSCPRCGDTYYIPVEISEDENIQVVQPMGEIFKPFPTDDPAAIVIDEPELMTLEVNKPLKYVEQERLKQFCNMSYVGKDGFALLVGDVSLEPIRHKCVDLIGEQQGQCCENNYRQTPK